MNIGKELKRVKDQSAKQQEEIKELKDLLEAKNQVEKQKLQLDELKKQVNPKFSFKLPKVFKRAIPFAIAVIVLFSVIALYTPTTRATTPVVAYSSIADGATFVDVVAGEGVYLTVNVSDADTNLQSVNIYSNSTGTWTSIYSSGALGGVAYHNTSSFIVSDWTGSWTKYYFNITANDGSDTEFQYSFTTEYVFGSPKTLVIDDVQSVTRGIILKNDTDDYYVWNDATGLDVITSTDFTKTAFESKTDINSATTIYNSFIYNNMPHVYYFGLSYARWNGSAWETGSTGIPQHVVTSGRHVYAYGGATKYFDGGWQVISGYGYASGISAVSRLDAYSSPTPYSGTTLLTQMGSTFTSSSTHTSYYLPSLAIYDSSLHCVFHNYDSLVSSDDDLHWWTYDGASWTDQGKLANDIDTGGCAIVTDITNDQLILFYIDGSNVLKYRAYGGSSWSDARTVFTPESGKDLSYLNAGYVDGRVIVSFGYNLRGNYNVYYIASPDYVSTNSGTNTTLNHIQFPDVQPNAVNVYSEVVGFKNINDRDILNVTWHFEDIGDLAIASNIRVWTNMSGGWNNIGTCDASGDVTKLDINTEMSDGGEWTPGMITYWKFEILSVGDIAETLHATDEDIYMLVDLGE